MVGCRDLYGYNQIVRCRGLGNNGDAHETSSATLGLRSLIRIRVSKNRASLIGVSYHTRITLE